MCGCMCVSARVVYVCERERGHMSAHVSVHVGGGETCTLNWEPRAGLSQAQGLYIFRKSKFLQ